jgi:hypothetical protein
MEGCLVLLMPHNAFRPTVKGDSTAKSGNVTARSRSLPTHQMASSLNWDLRYPYSATWTPEVLAQLAPRPHPAGMHLAQVRGTKLHGGSHMLRELIVAAGIFGGGDGLAAAVTGDQTYPHCNGISVLDPETPIEPVHGTVLDVREVHPCAGQPYLLVRIESADRIVSVYLGPGSFLTEQGITIVPGETLSGDAAHAGHILTALTIEVGGRAVALRDAQGRPLWSRTGVTH